MNTNKMLVLIAILFFSFSSCDPCVAFSCSDPYYFKIIDKTSGLDLVFGPAPIYKLDSLRLTQCPTNSLNNNCGYYATINQYNNLLFVDPKFPVDTIYLRLSSFDVDTLIINNDYRETQCCGTGFGKINGITFNGTTVAKNGNAFIFSK